MPLPAEHADGSVILMLPEAGGARFVASDLEQLSRLETTLSLVDPVEAYLYDARLEAMRIPEGVLVDSPDGARLPSPAKRLRLSFPENGEPAWLEIDSAPRLDRLRIEHISPCRRFDVQTVMFEPSRSVMLEPLPDGRLLFGRFRIIDGVDSTAFVAIDAQGDVEPLAVQRDPTIYSGTISGGRLWMGGAAGRVLHAPLDDLTLTSSIASTPSGEPIRGLVVRELKGRFEVLALSGSGTLELFDGVGWTTLRRETYGDDDEVALLRLEDGEVLVATPHERLVTSVRNGATTDEPLSSSGAPTSLGFIRGQPVAGLPGGEIFAREGAGLWRGLPPVRFHVKVLSFGSIDGGFLVGGGDSALVEWNDELGEFCDLVPLGGGGGVYFIRRIGDLIVLAGRPVSARIGLELRLLRERTS